MNPLVKATDICKATGATYRQVEYWTRRGYLKSRWGQSPGSGSWHEYAPIEIGIARLLTALSSVGMLYNASYIPSLTEHVRANGLIGDVALNDLITLHLDTIRPRG